jgi:3-oxoacyl-(acyl-carrier-protein) synthase
MIKGIGWITQNKYGCKKRRLEQGYSDLKSLYARLQPEIFRYPVENFFRFDTVSKLTAVSIALALFDAKIAYAKDKKQEISILGANSSGARKANLTYFKDYIDHGRTLARGNLFIYTLPSSPLAEAAIHFGLTGKLQHLGFAKNTKTESLSYALNMLKTQSQKMIILVNTDSKTSMSYLLQK